MTTKLKPKPTDKGEAMIAQAKSKTKTNPHAGEPREIPITSIQPHPLNVRETIDPMEIQKLGASLDREGLLQRPIVRPLGNKFQLIAGARRYEAAKAAGWQTLPVEIRCVDDSTAIIMLAAENFFRKQLNPIERAKSLQLLMSPETEGGAGRTLNEAAAILGKSPAWLAKQIRLLKLPEPWRCRVASGEIDGPTGLKLTPYHDKPEILAALDADMRTHPDEWKSPKLLDRIVQLAEGLGAITSRVRRTQLIERASQDTGGKTAGSLREVAEYFDVAKNAVDRWKAAGAPLDGAPFDLAAIAAWLKQRQDRDDAAGGKRSRRTLNSLPARRARVVQLDSFRSATKMRARPKLLDEMGAFTLLEPYQNSLGDLELIKAHCETLIADLKREAAAKN